MSKWKKTTIPLACCSTLANGEVPGVFTRPSGVIQKNGYTIPRGTV